MNNSLVQGTMKIARRAVIMSFIGTTLIVGALVAERIYFEKAFDTAASKAVRTATTSGHIMLEHERLTMSANMAAATGNLVWMQRYLDRIIPMDEAMSDGQDLATNDIAETFDRETKTAYDSLIAIETKAFQQVKIGNLAQAAAILNSAEYQDQKKILTDGTDHFVSMLAKQNQKQVDDVKSIANIVLALLGVMGIAGAAGIWMMLRRRLGDSEIENLHVEQRLNLRAMHDELTGLPNRRTFNERTTAIIERCSQTKIGMVSVAMIDLDNFKDINDTLGHHFGDALIREIARRFSAAMPEGSILARFGGDEFAVANNILNEAHAEQIRQHMAGAFKAPFEVLGETLRITASIGVAVFPMHGDNVAEMLRVADIALYKAKDDGRGRIRLFYPEMDVKVKERKLLELDLRHAIETDQLELHYQTLMSSNAKQVTGLEALVRWRHPEKGMISPSIFIPIAEQSGLIIQLGQWVMARAFKDAARWPDMMLAINLSPKQFRHSNFVNMVKSLVEETGVNPHRIEFEVTESLLLEENGIIQSILSSLHNMGFRFSLDDFGTGYSSLSYLRKFPFNKIKIDQSFIKSIETSNEAAQIIQSVVNLGKALHMTVTAEGVETVEQFNFLHAAGCQQLQGFLFSHPAPAQEIDVLLRKAASKVRLRA